VRRECTTQRLTKPGHIFFFFLPLSRTDKQYKEDGCAQSGDVGKDDKKGGPGGAPAGGAVGGGGDERTDKNGGETCW